MSGFSEEALEAKGKGREAKQQKTVDVSEAEKERRQKILGSVDNEGLRLFMQWSFDTTDLNTASRTQTDARVSEIAQTGLLVQLRPA